MSRPSLQTLVDNPVVLFHLTTRGLEMLEPHPHDKDAAFRVAISACEPHISRRVDFALFLTPSQSNIPCSYGRGFPLAYT